MIVRSVSCYVLIMVLGVSGAHNTIVTARAGKDLVSSLVSGEFCKLMVHIDI